MLSCLCLLGMCCVWSAAAISIERARPGCLSCRLMRATLVVSCQLATYSRLGAD